MAAGRTLPTHELGLLRRAIIALARRKLPTQALRDNCSSTSTIIFGVALEVQVLGVQFLTQIRVFVVGILVRTAFRIVFVSTAFVATLVMLQVGDLAFFTRFLFVRKLPDQVRAVVTFLRRCLAAIFVRFEVQVRPLTVLSLIIPASLLLYFLRRVAELVLRDSLVNLPVDRLVVSL